MIRALFIEDEETLAKVVKESLENRDFSVTVESDGNSALSTFYDIDPDVVIMDVMLPRKDGFTLTNEIRNVDKKTPIIFLTAKSQTEDVVKGFKTGGNDYLTKPFSMEELIIRIKSLLGQNIDSSKSNKKNSIFQVGKYRFNSKTQMLSHKEKERELTYKENELLKMLCQNKNQVLKRKTALLKLWGNDTFFNARSMDVFITKLRSYLNKDSNIKILNIRGVGFKLID